MADTDQPESQMAQIAERLAEGWAFPGSADPEKARQLARQEEIRRLLHDLIVVLFPGCHGDSPDTGESPEDCVKSVLRRINRDLKDYVRRSLQYACRKTECEARTHCETCEEQAEVIADGFIDALPDLQALIGTDITAAFEGDPAAQSTMEVVQSYPGLYATIVHRIAHYLYEQDVPMIPRIMSELAHSLTGIDVHPGARIGTHFFIDHGTGVVVGETAVIGNHVKLYQGVTLGALSFERDEQGRLIKGIKRHPEVGDHVVIYAGATILGGETAIGSHSVVGGNVWLTRSVPPGSKVYNRQPDPLIRQGSHPGTEG